MIRFNFFKRKLHVFFIVVIVEIVAAIMHGQKITEADILVKRLVFGEVPEKGRELQYLIQRGSIEYDDRQDDM